MERKTKEFVCECQDNVIVIAEGDTKQCMSCGKEFAYDYESMETMYNDLISYRKLAQKNWNNLVNVNIKLSFIITLIKENKFFEEIKEKIFEAKEMSMQYHMTAMNRLRFFYGNEDCEDCE
jgi:hypothetical protein